MKPVPRSRLEQERRAVIVLGATGDKAPPDLERLLSLQASGLERWLAKQSGPGEGADFTANQSVTNGHDNNVNEELPWH